MTPPRIAHDGTLWTLTIDTATIRRDAAIRARAASDWSYAHALERTTQGPKA